MQDTVIIPDTNVIVSASIMQNLQKLGVVKHVFYDESIQMFSLFMTRSDVKGVVVPQVMTECFRVLAQSAKNTLVHETHRLSPTTKSYEHAIGIAVSSNLRMLRLLRRLSLAEIDDDEFLKNLRRVVDMSTDLKRIYEKTYKTRESRINEAKDRAKSTATEPAWSKEQKNEVISTYKMQVKCEARQLARFVGKYPNKSDQKILAQAITYKDSLLNTGEIFIASLDMGFFSPHRRGVTVSDIVTKRIFREFKITCDLPRRVFEIVHGD